MPHSQTQEATPEGQLAEEYDLGEFQIRPPKEFELKSDDRMPEGLGRLIVWRSPDDRCGFSVALITIPEGKERASPELVRELGRTKGLNNYVETPPEKCTLANLSFELCRAQYVHRNDAEKMSSVSYSHVEGHKGILIWYSSPIGAYERRLKIAMTAAQSLRRS
jgi:hypothetical protein